MRRTPIVCKVIRERCFDPCLPCNPNAFRFPINFSQEWFWKINIHALGISPRTLRIFQIHELRHILAGFKTPFERFGRNGLFAIAARYRVFRLFHKLPLLFCGLYARKLYEFDPRVWL